MGVMDQIKSTWEELVGMNIRQLLMQGVNLGELITSWLIVSPAASHEHSIVSRMRCSQSIAAVPCRLDRHLSPDDMEEPHPDHWIRITGTPHSARPCAPASSALAEKAVYWLRVVLGRARQMANSAAISARFCRSVAGCGGPEW